MKGYYETLGLPPTATADDIRRAYRTLARRYHPDVNPGRASEEKFKAISEAYRILSDPSSRQKYDAERTAQRAEQFKAYTAQQREFKRRTTEKKKAPPPPPPLQDPPTSSFFLWALHRLFGRKKRELQEFSVIEVTVTAKEAIFGTAKKVLLTGGGKEERIRVRIPPGSYSGAVLHLKSTGKAPRSIAAVLRVASHPHLEVQPRGIIIEVPITPFEAIEGCTREVPALEGKLRLTIPPATQGGTELKAKGQGVKFRDGTRGDIYYRVQIRIPMNAPILIKEASRVLSEAVTLPPFPFSSLKELS